MARKRLRKGHVAMIRVTAEAVEAFRAKDYARLHRLLGLRPWDCSPIDSFGDCPYPAGSGGELSWDRVVGLRKALIHADY